MYLRKRKGFTLIEVLVALAITAISLVALLRLLVVNINTMDSASYLSRASLIGNEKIAEVVGNGNPKTGTENGRIQYEDNNAVFNWQINVTDEQPEEIDKLNLHGLKKVNVRVVWKQGRSERQVSMSTYICPDKETEDVLMAENIR
ncbi:MAG: prepilin-type N-terminal cleavage/methylation domain-containing protein [Sedimentisphaerales bacterium]|nr:prepilin-type N-terminal cleavage/methylation domain-containing protein [Sedimentisphaerales bacterium]